MTTLTRSNMSERKGASPVVTCGCVWLQWVCTNEYCDRRPLVPMKIGVMLERHPRSDFAGVTVGVAAFRPGPGSGFFIGLLG